MKTLISILVLALALCWAAPAQADSIYDEDGISWTNAGHIVQDMFNKQEDQLLDFAIASSLEGVFYYGNAGRKGFGGQIPLVYLGYGFVSADLGYVTLTDSDRTDVRASSLNEARLAYGVSIRVNRILEAHFPEAVHKIQLFNETTYDMWDRLFFGPAYTYVDNPSEHIGWFKCGFKLF